MSQNIDILVIGAGQAGLATGYHLKKQTSRFLIVDRYRRVGDSWRKRYDSLRLFTPRRYSALPGLSLPGQPLDYPSRDEFADYLETYARRFELPLMLNAGIQRLEQANSHFAATCADGERVEASYVILATGSFQKPLIPHFAKNISKEIRQFSAEDYRNPAQVPPGNVVVVGDGAMGRDVAVDLAEAHTVYLATGKPRRLLPERLLGISSWIWMDKLGLLRAQTGTRIGRKLQEADAFPNRERDFKALRQKGIHIMPKLVQVEDCIAIFENGERVAVASIIWATGYQDDSDWVAIPEVKDGRGSFIHQKGISPVKNLYFIGRPWQTSLGSARVEGVGRDAEMIVTAILKENT